MAVLASFGLLLFCGMPFAMTVASAPFLILVGVPQLMFTGSQSLLPPGVGVDDMFIMISCWQKTEVDKAVEVRLAETYKEAGVSITITTLTDVLAFYIGLLTPFRSVQSFCMYTSTALLFCYIFNITFFGACLALNGRREKGNRHWLTCMRVPEASGDGNVCCVGGAYDKDTRKEFEMPMDSFFKNYYGPFLTRVWVKVLVCLIYAGYLSVSIYGCFQIQEGLDLKHLAADGSYVGDYYDNEDEFFSDFGPNVIEKSSANEKATDAINKLGYPIVQGAVSTIAGVVVLAAAKSYIFRTFFKIMFLVILFGAVHGIAFIPVFLTFLGTCHEKK
ncbi:hypothetical protein G5714_022094 [Onychostoma macrolepis]|uniref:SSD domain-containing protein n=1 Tax=Onychostoma macrolepis TaxID=369639 RepID=A0A7J6BSY5_9TELE|nr:hypothetical protein G5714_022094 [Onychostoma macrolepis]